MLRRVSWASSILALLLAAVLPAWAARPVEVYDVTVPGSDHSAVEAAMRQALVRATGREDAATDPALAQLVTHADQYVRSVRPVADGEVQVSFDGPAVERQITAAGRSVWDSDRPFTLIVLTPAPTGAADDEARRELEQIAERRGLPVSLVPMPVTDPNGNPLSANVLLTSAERLGGDAVLLGRADPASPGEWQWTLITGLATRSWNGPLAGGIGGAADALARVEGSALPLTDEEATIEVSGIGTLADYAAVERTLEELPGVRRSGIEAADGTTATFSVLIRGGAQAIERVLEGSQHFTPATPTGTAAPAIPGVPDGVAPGSVSAPVNGATSSTESAPSTGAAPSSGTPTGTGITRGGAAPAGAPEPPTTLAYQYHP